MDSNPKIKVLQICSSSAVSGAERHVLGLSRQLVQDGHFVHALCPTDGWLPRTLTQSGISNEIIHMRGLGRWNTIARSVVLIRKHRLDLVHTHLTRAACLGQIIGNITRKPVITSVHVANDDEVYPILARRRNKLIAVSDYIRNRLLAQGISDQYIRTIYNGTDLASLPATNPTLTKQQLGIPKDHFIIGILGRVCREKGALEAVHSLKGLITEFPKLHLLLVGKIVEGFEAELKALIRVHGLTNHVTFTGEQEDVVPLIDAFDICAMPSHMETFGVAALEAMARGKAVVATNVGGLPEIISSKTGLLVEPGIENLIVGLRYLLLNPALQTSLGAQARLTVEANFTLRHMVSEFEDAYRQCIR